jgi:uncharacterized phage protein gp47/JayE
MPDLPTRLDYFRIGANEVLSRSEERPPGERISPKEVFTAGSDINIVIASASAMAEEVTRQLSIRISALLLDGARGEDLDRLVADRFSVTVIRKGATPAQGNVLLTRIVPGPAVNFPVNTKVKASDGTEFEFTVAVGVPEGIAAPNPGANLPQNITVPVEAVVAGLTGNVAPDTVNQFVGPTEPTITVNNPPRPPLLPPGETWLYGPMVGGAPTETDASLRERARAFFKVARRGTLAAIEFGALTVPGVAKASGYEVLDMFGVPTGDVFLFIADLNGNANAALISAVQAALLEWRAAGVPVIVQGSEPVFVDIEYNLQFEAGFDSTVVFQQVQNAVLSFVNLLPPGTGQPNGPGVLRESDLLAIARSVTGTIVLDDALINPVGDVVPAQGQSLRTALDRITNT